MNLAKQLSATKIDKVKGWLDEIMQAGSREMIQIERDTGWQNDEYEYCAYIYTGLNRYHIAAIDRLNQPGYLGCTVTSRYPRPGECWRRGRDLPDGALEHETWERIKAHILAYEMVRPDPHQTSITATFELLSHTLQGALTITYQAKMNGYWQLPDFTGGAIPMTPTGSPVVAPPMTPTGSSAAAPTPVIPTAGSPAAAPKPVIPTALIDSVVDILSVVLEQLPVEMLPELIIAKDPYVRAATKRIVKLGAK